MLYCAIKDVANLVRGVTYKKDQASKEPFKGSISILRANNIVEGRIDFSDLVFVPAALASDEQHLAAGDIVITMSSGSKNHVGKVALFKTSMEMAFGAFCAKLSPIDVLPEYLLYILRSNSFRKHIEQLSKGTNINNIKADHILDYMIPVPPLDEQERIVARIEELFSQLDSGVETLRKIKQQLAVYRQAVLKEAFADCDDKVIMGSVATMIDPQPSHRTPPEFENGIPYIGIGDIDYTGKTIRFKDARKVNPAVYEEHLKRYTLHVGDFVMGKIGTIGKPFRLPLPQNYTLSANVILIQPDEEKINPEYLFWQFSSPLITEQLLEGKNETSQPAFGIQKARLLAIKMCSPEAQEQIVFDIREKMSVCDSIEQTVDTALQQAEAMRQSILKQAFEGGN